MKLFQKQTAKGNQKHIFSFEFLHRSQKHPLLFLRELKYFLVKGIATFINGPAILLNNDPKNPPD